MPQANGAREVVWNLRGNLKTIYRRHLWITPLANIASGFGSYSPLLYFAAIVLSYIYFPPLPPLPTLTDRLVFTLQCHILTVGAVFNAFNVSIVESIYE